MLQGKKILIGICGGIAAYKTQFLIRLLIKEGAQVKVVLTPDAKNFVTPLTLSVLSQNPIAIDTFDKNNGTWYSHIDLGLWADAFIIAPITANTIAKMANGITDNLLLATTLAARCPIFLAPSMDVDMYLHDSTRKNISTLIGRGHILIAPVEGALASGLTGLGRLEEPENIINVIKAHLRKTTSLIGKTILISSGPTIEPIDPVRFISNHSSGKMGNALAKEAAFRGANVILVSGPVNEYPKHPNIQIDKVNTADEMYKACMQYAQKYDIAVMAAAVADYTVLNPENTKIKKKEQSLTIQLSKTKDILLELGNQKSNKQVLVGFALETENETENATHKLHTKNLDFIVLNSLKNKNTGFGFDTNQITIISKNGKTNDFVLKSKNDVASDILDLITEEK